MHQYKRPFVPPSPAPPPKPPGGPPAPVGRHPLPDDKTAAIAVVRFLLQVWILGTLAVYLVRLCASFSFLLTVGLLFGCGALLLLTAGLKYVWVGRTSRLPLLTVLSLLTVAPCVIGSLTAVTSPVMLMGGLFAVLTLVGVGRIGWWADGATMWLDARATLALSAAALVLTVVAVVPPALGAARFLFVIAIVGNGLLGLAVLYTYVGYTLANPAHPQDTVDSAAAFWRRVRRFKEPYLLPPAVGTALTVVACSAVFLLLPADMPEQVGPAKPSTATATDLRPWIHEVICWALTAGALAIAALGAIGWYYRRPVGRAVAVFLLYTGEPSPGIYAPAWPLNTVRVRQVFAALVLFTNVLAVRTLTAEYDAGLIRQVSNITRVLATDGNDDHKTTTLLLLLQYALTFITPVLFMAGEVLFRHAYVLRSMHLRLEEATPVDLYPPKKEA